MDLLYFISPQKLSVMSKGAAIANFIHRIRIATSLFEGKEIVWMSEIISDTFGILQNEDVTPGPDVGSVKA